MEIAVAGRRTEISDRFRDLVDEKLAKVEQLAPRAHRIDVEVTRETNPSMSDVKERVELTIKGKGPIIRAEAAAPDRVVALDLAVDKLYERLRRARDRRKSHQGLSMREVLADVSVGAVPAEILVETEADAAEVVEAAGAQGPLVVNGAPVVQRLGDSPVVIRQKLHTPDRLTIAEAVEQMELVGHDFYLFIDSDSSRPAAVYRRKGWTYGVLQLDATVS
jgi:ribosomal subunit interface protein